MCFLLNVTFVCQRDIHVIIHCINRKCHYNSNCFTKQVRKFRNSIQSDSHISTDSMALTTLSKDDTKPEKPKKRKKEKDKKDKKASKPLLMGANNYDTKVGLLWRHKVRLTHPNLCSREGGNTYDTKVGLLWHHKDRLTHPDLCSWGPIIMTQR